MESSREGQGTATSDEENATAEEKQDGSSEHEESGGASQGESGDREDAQGSGKDQEDAQASGEDREKAQASSEDEESAEASGKDQEDAQGSGEDQEKAQGAGDDQDGGGDEQDGEDEEDGGSASGGSVARAIEDVSSLPGETVNDQDGRKIGEVKDIYATGDDETPMWVTIESATGLGRSRDVFVPLARIKRQKDEIRVPYSYAHIHESPEVEPGDELSEEDDRALRVYYAIGLADQELVADAQSYASQVPDEDEPARKVDPSSAEGPVREIDDAPPAERAAEAYEKQKEEEGDEHRQSSGATADDIFEEDGAGDDKDGDSEEKGDEDSKDEDSEEQPKGDSSEERPKDEAKEDGD